MSTSFTNRLGSSPEEGIKAACVVSSSSNITLSGEQTIDSLAVVAGNRVLVRSQTDASENGIYDASTGAWTRSTDFNDATDVINGVLVVDSNSSIIYQVEFTGTIVFGTTEITFSAQPYASHIADTTDAHDASAISLLDTLGIYDATDVEGALAEIQSGYTNKADAVTHSPVNGVIRWIGGTDGGWFKEVTGGSGYSDNGGSYCGTQFIPTGGDGSAAWLRVDTTDINTAMFGDPLDGSTDATTAIFNTDATGLPYKIKNGTTVFTGQNLPNIDNLTIENATVIDGNGNQCIYVDEEINKVIGLMHNYLEETIASTGPAVPAITNGNITTAPHAEFSPVSNIDVCAFWYQDFGLDATRYGALGDKVWYDWHWNFTQNSGNCTTTFCYDPKRHPLLGYYRGDNGDVIDWQSYWLLRYGVTSLSVQLYGNTTGTLTSTWTNAYDKAFWVYSALTTAKNFKKLKYHLWGIPAGTTTEIENAWQDVIDNVYSTYTNVHTVNKNNKKYAVIYCFDGEAIRGVFDSYVGSTLTEAFYIRMAARAKLIGYDGICIISRLPSTSLIGKSDLEESGVVYLAGRYESPLFTPDTNSYADFIDNMTYDTSKQYYEVMSNAVEANSQYPHPSAWTRSRSTPALFERAIKESVNQINKAGDNKLLMIYNVSEWAEGGAALQPTVASGFDYLVALKNALLTSGEEIKNNINKLSASTQAFNTLEIPIIPDQEYVRIYANFDDLTATLPAATNGRRLVIFNPVSTYSGRVRFVTAGNVNVSLLAATYIRLTTGAFAEFVGDGNVWVATNTNGDRV